MFNIIVYTVLTLSLILFIMSISFLTIVGYNFVKYKIIDIKDIKDIIESILIIIVGIVSIVHFILVLKLL